MRMIRTLIKATYDGAVRFFDGVGRPGESFTRREYMQHYGFASRPPEGAEGVIFVTGSAVVMIATDDRRYRVEMADREVALYTDEGDKIHFRRGNLLEIKTGRLVIDAAESCVIRSPELVIEASTRVAIDSPAVAASGDVSDGAGTMAAMRGVYNPHTHTESGGGTTQGPGEGM